MLEVIHTILVDDPAEALALAKAVGLPAGRYPVLNSHGTHDETLWRAVAKTRREALEAGLRDGGVDGFFER